jgi:hypothetical protein
MKHPEFDPLGVDLESLLYVTLVLYLLVFDSLVSTYNSKMLRESGGYRLSS